MEHECTKEQDWGKLWEIVKTFSHHVEDGDKLGGWRDRLMLAEMNIKDTTKVVAEIKQEIKFKIYQASIIGGIIGGLVGAGSKDVLMVFIQWMMGK